MKNLLKFLTVATLAINSMAASLDNPPSSIVAAQKNGIELIEHFNVDSGMDGWLIKNKTGYNIWWSDDAGYVMVGAYLDPAGVNLTAKYLEELAPVPDYQKILDRAEYVSTHPDMSAENPIYVFYEPHCGFCSAFHAAVKPYVENGAEVRWIPVAFLKPKGSPGQPSSYELVSKILKSDNPISVIDEHEEIKTLSGGRGGLTSGVPADASVFKTAEQNSSVMRELGFGGTPAIAYKDVNGKFVLVKGFPKLAELPSILNMPRMDSADGRLGRFGANPSAYPVKK